MAEKKLNIKVSTTGAAKAKKQVGGLNGAISKMGKAVGIASAAYFGARGLISGFSSAINLAGIQEQAEKKLSTALGHTSKSLLAHASALQRMTTFGDEAIIGVQASLAAFIKDEEQIKKATIATLDLSVAMGMDLKSAGDLIAKTLGSSMNAMSRYGVEVVGAVGSTERLESLTNNVAKLFGGQASAQADTMTGALEQMKNALGDVSENIGFSLSPLVIKLAKGINSLATSTADESAEANSLFNVLKDVNATEEVRERAMQAINEQYGDYLPNLIDETFSLQDIEKAQDRVTGAMLKRIALAVNEAEIADLMRTQLELRDKEPELIDKSVNAHKAYQDAVSNAQANADVLAASQDMNSRNDTASAVKSANALHNLKKNREDQVKIQTEINALNQSAVSLADAFSETIIRMPDRPLINMFDPDDIDILPDVIIDMKEMIDMMDEAFGESSDDTGVDTMATTLSSYESMANGIMNLSDSMTAHKMQNLDNERQKEIDAAMASGGTEEQKQSRIQNIKEKYSKEERKLRQAQKLPMIAQAIAGTASAVVGALGNKPWTPLNIGLAALVGIAGAVEVATIQAQQFAKGGDFVTTGPQMIMVGDNAGGRERVQVTPLSSPNINGPQGGITLNISAPLIDEHILDTIIPAIQKAQRMNLA